MSLHAARSDEDWLQGRVNQGLLNQGAKISTTNINISDTDELDEWSNDHMGGHMAKRMPNGEQNEELLTDNTDCRNQDTTPTLAPLEANLPTEVSTLMNALQDTAPGLTGHQEGDQSSDRHMTSLTLHNMCSDAALAALLSMVIDLQEVPNGSP